MAHFILNLDIVEGQPFKVGQTVKRGDELRVTVDGRSNYPRGIVVDASGNVYVADTGNYRIQTFTSGGAFMAKWGTVGSADGQFRNPNGVAVDASGNVYVADTGNNRIQVFASGKVP